MKILKKIMAVIGIVSVLVMSMMLAACPNPETTTTIAASAPEINEAEANNAVSGISANVTVKGTIENTACDIALDASMGTFIATQCNSANASVISRSGVTFSGEFFYYNDALQLMLVTGACYKADVANLADGMTVTLNQSDFTEYSNAKTSFKKSVEDSVASILKKIDSSLKDEEVKYEKTSDGISIKAFGQTFALIVQMNIGGFPDIGMDETTPVWFKSVFNYVDGIISSTNGDYTSILAAFNKNYPNINAAVMKMMTVLLGDNISVLIPTDQSSDLAEFEQKLNAGWTISAKDGVVTITIGTESFSLDLTKNDLSALESVPAWFIKLFQTLNIANVMDGSNSDISNIQSVLTQKYGDYQKVCEFAADFFQKFMLSMAGDLSDDVRAIIDAAEIKLADYTDYTFATDATVTDGSKFSIIFIGTTATETTTVNVTMIGEKATVDNTSFGWLADYISLFVDISPAKLLGIASEMKTEIDDDGNVTTETSDTDSINDIPDDPGDQAMLALMTYIASKTKVFAFTNKFMTFIGQMMGSIDSDFAEYKDLLDAAEAVLSNYLPDGIKFSMKASGTGFAPFMILGNETDSNYLEFCIVVNSEPVPPEWFINLKSVGSMITPDTSADSPMITALKDNYPGVAKLFIEYIKLINNSNPMSGLLDELFGDVTSDLAKGEAYLNGKTFDVTIDTTDTAGAVIKIAINGTSATDKLEWTINPEGTGVISDSAPGWFKAVFPIIVGAANKNGDFYNDLQTVMAALSTNYRNVAQLMYNIFAVTIQMSNSEDNPLTKYVNELNAAETVLRDYVNSNMTAVMTRDGLQITIGGEGTDKIEFVYIPSETATQSTDVPEWFKSLFPVISTLMDGTSGDNTAAATMAYLTQNYPGTAALSQAIAAAMQNIASNTGD